MDDQEAIKSAVDIAVKNTNDANSLLIYITLISVGGLCALCVYIFHKVVNSQEKKNESYESIMKTLSTNQENTNILLAKMELQLEYHSESIKETKTDLRIIKNG